jgi:hypothetical protein
MTMIEEKTAEDIDRLNLRIGKKPDDRELAEYIARSLNEGMNLSNLIKELLRAYYRGDLDTFNQPGGPTATEVIDERAQAAKARFKKVSFDKLGQ